MSTIEERFEQMQPAFDLAAHRVAEEIRLTQFSELILEPGDVTQYRFIFLGPGRYATQVQGPEPRLLPNHYQKEWLVTLTMGASYPWAGHHIHWDYAHKWVPDGRHNEWTQRVVAALLNAIADELKEEA